MAAARARVERLPAGDAGADPRRQRSDRRAAHGHRGYHATITVASLRAGEAWLAASAHLSLSAALGELLGSEYGRCHWPLAHWSKASLCSVAARRAWVDPDLRPLPF